MNERRFPAGTNGPAPVGGDVQWRVNLQAEKYGQALGMYDSIESALKM
jgi:hypothetical protein